MTWTVVEPGLAIVASNLATVRPLLRAMRIRGFNSTEQHQYAYVSSQNHENSTSRYNQPSASLARSHSPRSINEIAAPETHSMEDSRPYEGQAEVETFTGQDENDIQTHGPTRDPRGSEWERNARPGGVEQIHDLEAQAFHSEQRQV